MTKPVRIKKLALHTTQGEAGALLRESQFVVRYGEEALGRPALAISLTMPPRADGWRSNLLHPVLAMNLPEGFLLERVLDRYRKAIDIDDMNLLAVTSTRSAGRVWASVPGESAAAPAAPIALRELLAHPGTEALFDELLERYATASISGVQPKVVVPEHVAAHGTLVDKSAIKSPDLIVKSAGGHFPGLAENEFVCMSVAKHAGLETPPFYLSEDRRLFVIRRFDIGAGGYLGFEDLAVLTGRHPRSKYEGTYADVAKAVRLNAAPAHRASSLDALFRLVVLNCVIRNGDAHLKNFGVLYGDPATADHDARLAPVFDLVCTTLYLPGDVLALGLGGSKAWPDRRRLERFGAEACGVRNPGQAIDEVVDRAMAYRHPDAESAVWQRIRAEMEKGVRDVEASRRPRR